MTILDPILANPLDDLARRVGALEQRPKVTAPLAMYPRRVGTPGPFADWYSTTVSATFETLWTVTAPVVPLPMLYVVQYLTDSGATGEVRVQIANASGTVTSSVVVYPGVPPSQVQSLVWLHNVALWTGGPVTVTVQARRTSGAGLFYVNLPILGWYDSRSGTPVGGTWYAFWWAP